MRARQEDDLLRDESLTEERAMKLVKERVGPLSSSELADIAAEWNSFLVAPDREGVEEIIETIIRSRIERKAQRGENAGKRPLTAGQLRMQILLEQNKYCDKRTQDWRMEFFGTSDPPFPERCKAEEWFLETWNTEPGEDDGSVSTEYTIHVQVRTQELSGPDVLHELAKLCGFIVESIRGTSYAQAQDYVLLGIIPELPDSIMRHVGSGIEILLTDPMKSPERIKQDLIKGRKELWGVSRAETLDERACRLLTHCFRHKQESRKAQWQSWYKEYPEHYMSFDNYRKSVTRAKARLLGRKPCSRNLPFVGKN